MSSCVLITNPISGVMSSPSSLASAGAGPPLFLRSTSRSSDCIGKGTRLLSEHESCVQGRWEFGCAVELEQPGFSPEHCTGKVTHGWTAAASSASPYNLHCAQTPRIHSGKTSFVARRVLGFRGHPTPPCVVALRRSTYWTVPLTLSTSHTVAPTAARKRGAAANKGVASHRELGRRLVRIQTPPRRLYIHMHRASSAATDPTFGITCETAVCDGVKSDGPHTGAVGS